MKRPGTERIKTKKRRSTSRPNTHHRKVRAGVLPSPQRQQQGPTDVATAVPSKMSQRLKRTTSSSPAAAAAAEQEQRGPSLNPLSTSPKGDIFGDSAVGQRAGSTIDLGAEAASSIDLAEGSCDKGPARTASWSCAEEPFDVPSARTGRGDGGGTCGAHGGNTPDEGSDAGGRGDTSRDVSQRARHGLRAGAGVERAGVLKQTKTEEPGRDINGGHGGSNHARAGSAGSTSAATADGKRPSSPRLKRLEARTKRMGDGGGCSGSNGSDGGGEENRRGRSGGNHRNDFSVRSALAKGMTPSGGGPPRRMSTTPVIRKKQDHSGDNLGEKNVGRLDEELCVAKYQSACPGCTPLACFVQPATY